MYSSSQLLYAKNVKRDQGNDWAYLNIQAGDPFELNFPNNPKWKPTNYLRPQIGELIMIFQTINEGHGEDEGTYLTHLVTPIENVLGYDRNSTHPTTRLVLCLAKAEPIIKKSDAWNFKYPNRGQICDFDTIKRMKDKDWGISRKQKYFFDLFTIAQTISEENLTGIVGESIELEDELTGLEGLQGIN
ncbi:MAG: hypothetical protein IPO03_05200 [Bacteroidetes bacterium]|nr:hypothetical protein [Bacteroidota bacterium]